MFEHFLDAQADIFPKALSELQNGEKRSHWMWFVFPQLEGLGNSPMARRFGLCGIEDAIDYLSHPVLGVRLRTATRAVMAYHGLKTAHEIFGYPDDLKFRSCMTLFARAAPGEPIFSQAIDAFYDGIEDPETMRRL